MLDPLSLDRDYTDTVYYRGLYGRTILIPRLDKLSEDPTVYNDFAVDDLTPSILKKSHRRNIITEEEGVMALAALVDLSTSIQPPSIDHTQELAMILQSLAVQPDQLASEERTDHVLPPNDLDISLHDLQLQEDPATVDHSVELPADSPSIRQSLLTDHTITPEARPITVDCNVTPDARPVTVDCNVTPEADCLSPVLEQREPILSESAERGSSFDLSTALASGMKNIPGPASTHGHGSRPLQSSQPYSTQFSASRIAMGRSFPLKQNRVFNVFYTAKTEGNIWAKLSFDLYKQEIHVIFKHAYQNKSSNIFVVRIPFSDLIGNIMLAKRSGAQIVRLRTKGPAKWYRKDRKFDNVRQESVFASRDDLRVAEIRFREEPETDKQGPVMIYHSEALFEHGRCTEFEATLNDPDADARLKKVLHSLHHRNIEWSKLTGPEQVNIVNPAKYKSWWSDLYTLDIELPFDVLFMLESAVSLGNVDESQINDLLNALSRCSPKMAKQIMEQIASHIEPLGSVQETFKRLLKAGPQLSLVPNLPEYCCMVRRAIVTVTSMYLMPPQLEVSNRILRQYAEHNDRFLRVQFLDELGHGRLRHDALKSDPYNRVFRTLSQGLIIAGRLYEFLAFGNSQLREHGVYFFAVCQGSADCGNAKCSGLRAADIRAAIGDVSGIKIVAKQAARVGQAFSTTRLMRDRGLPTKSFRIPDKIGGVDDKFCFTDGVGLTSAAILTDIGREMGHIGLFPSAVQFRMGGAKGVLCLAPEPKFLAHLPIRERNIGLRPSQVKFESEHDSLEVIRIAKYRGAFLNRQYIVLLWTLGVETATFMDMQERYIRDLNLSLVDETVAAQQLRRHVDENGTAAFLAELVSFGFMAKRDPFVTQVIRLYRNWSLKNLKEKAKVFVKKGCYLMGVCDDTNTLKGHYDHMYDQDDSDIDAMDLPEVFIQITDPAADSKQPGRLKVIEQVCIIGRCPCLHPGDLRLVRAVNKPELHHLHDVLVFPTSGDQDLPSMCSGGDLDGDDYTVFWDPLLFPSVGNRYRRCMNYEGPKPVAAHNVNVRMIIDFVLNFFLNDHLGRIANMHLAFAHDIPHPTPEDPDGKVMRGFNPACLDLAELHSVAVDFPKTGVPAEVEIRRVSYPDFMEKPDRPSFVSDTPLSRMYRHVKLNMVDQEVSGDYGRVLQASPEMHEWIDYATTLKKGYDEAVRRLMAQYGVVNETEVVTGFLLDFDSRYSGKREFDMRSDLADKYSAIREMYREQVEQTSSTGSEGQRLAPLQTDKRRDAIVAAMYDVTHSQLVAVADKSQAMISFPWIYHDVLGRLSNCKERASKSTAQQLSELLIDFS